MSETPESSESTPTGEKHGISTSTVVKIVIIAVIAYIAYAIISSFNFDKIPGLKNLGDSFNNLTGALAYATGHWYLLGALLILGAFLPAAYKWAANKAGEGLKSGLSEEGFSAYCDAVVAQRANELAADESLSPEQRAQWEKTAADAKSRWDSRSDEAREEASGEAEKNGVDIPGDVKRRIM